MISQIILVAALASFAAASVLPIVHHAPQPYKFGYDVKDKHGEQYRQEEGNGGHAVKGSYGFTDARGVKRQVNYVADHAGFRAQVKTNEPGTANQNPAAVQMISDAPYAGGVALGSAALGGYGLGPAGVSPEGYGLGLGGAALGGYGLGLGGTALGGYGLGLGGAALGGYGLGLGGAALGGYGLGSTALGGYGLGSAGLGYGVVAPGYSVGVGLGGRGYGGYGLGGLGYARYGY